MGYWSRRGAMGLIAGMGAAAFVRPAFADGILAKIKAAGVLKIGTADNLPHSKMNPDGSLTGVAPLTVLAVTKKLGIPKVEAVVATYGQLIPGLLAGRWDMIGASLAISPERCAQVIFSDPFYRASQGDAVAFLPGTVKDPPKTFLELAQRFERVGMSTGERSAIMRRLLDSTGLKLEIVGFTDSGLMFDALSSKRVPIVTSDYKTVETMVKQRGGYEMAAIDNGQPIRGSAGAFRKEDTDLRDAFVAAQRELKKSGEVKAILAQYEFEYDEKFMAISGDEACKL